MDYVEESDGEDYVYCLNSMIDSTLGMHVNAVRKQI